MGKVTTINGRTVTKSGVIIRGEEVVISEDLMKKFTFKRFAEENGRAEFQEMKDELRRDPTADEFHLRLTLDWVQLRKEFDNVFRCMHNLPDMAGPLVVEHYICKDGELRETVIRPMTMEEIDKIEEEIEKKPSKFKRVLDLGKRILFAEEEVSTATKVTAVAGSLALFGAFAVPVLAEFTKNPIVTFLTETLDPTANAILFGIGAAGFVASRLKKETKNHNQKFHEQVDMLKHDSKAVYDKLIKSLNHKNGTQTENPA